MIKIEKSASKGNFLAIFKSLTAATKEVVDVLRLLMLLVMMITLQKSKGSKPQR